MPRQSPQLAHAYGWLRDRPDQRDLVYSAPPALLARLPRRADLRGKLPPVYDQGDLGSCTAQALAAAYAFCLRKQRHRRFTPSRLFIYYNERAMEGTVRSDAGAQLRDGIKSLNAQGVCPEPLWPYAVARFAERPPEPCYQVALRHQALAYHRVLQDLDQMRGCLAAGFPFALGFTVYESFETPEMARSGEGRLPSPKERSLGGHAVLAVGYDDSHHRFLLRNSWGLRWGRQGYFSLPYAYLVNPDLAADFWTLRIVEG